MSAVGTLSTNCRSLLAICRQPTNPALQSAPQVQLERWAHWTTAITTTTSIDSAANASASEAGSVAVPTQADNDLLATEILGLLKLNQSLLVHDKADMIQALQCLAGLWPVVLESVLRYPASSSFSSPASAGAGPQIECWRLLETLLAESDYMLDLPDASLFLGALRLYFAAAEALAPPDARIPTTVNLTGTSSTASTHIRPVSHQRSRCPQPLSAESGGGPHRPASPYLSPNQLAKLARAYFEKTMLVLQSPQVPASGITAFFELAGGFLRLRPDFLPPTLAQVTAWRDEPSQKFSTFQWKCVDKTLRIQLFNLYKILHQATSQLLQAKAPVPDAKSPFALPQLAKLLVNRGVRRDLDSYLNRYARFLQQQRHQMHLTRTSQPTAVPAPAVPKAPTASSSRAKPPPSASAPGDLNVSTIPLSVVIQVITTSFPPLDSNDIHRIVQVLKGPRFAVPGPSSNANSNHLKRPRESGPGDQNAGTVDQQPGPDAEAKRIKTELGDPSATDHRPPVDYLNEPATATTVASPPGDLEPEPELEPDADCPTSMLQFAFTRILDAGLDIFQAAHLRRFPSGNQLLMAPTLTTTTTVLANGDAQLAPPTAERLMTDWMVLVSRQATWFLSTSVEQSAPTPTTDQPSGQDANAPAGTAAAMADQLVKFITDEFRTRYELAILWLYELWYQSTQQNSPLPEALGYTTWYHKFLDHALENADPRDVVVGKLVLDAPDLPATTFARLEKHYLDPMKQKVVMAALRDLVDLRPPFRKLALQVIIQFSTATDRSTRQLTIKMLRKWYQQHESLTTPILAFATQSFESLVKLPPPEAIISKSDQDPSVTTEESVPGESSSEDSPSHPPAPESQNSNAKTAQPSPPTTTESAGGKTEPAESEEKTAEGLDPLATARRYIEGQVVQRSELFLALCSKNHELFNQIFALYPRLSPFTQQILRTHITDLVKSIGTQSSGFLRALSQCPPAAEELALSTVWVLVDRQGLTTDFAEAIVALCTEQSLKADFLIPVLPGLASKKAVLQNLGPVVKRLGDGDADPTRTSELLHKLITPSAPPPPAASTTTTAAAGKAIEAAPGADTDSAELRRPLLTPNELLVAIHNMEGTVGVKATNTAVKLCLDMPSTYSSEILAAVVQHLLAQSKISESTLETMKQSVTMYKSLTNYIVNLLSVMLQKRVWTSPTMWVGFLECCKATLPSSCEVLLQLPKLQLTDALQKYPDLRAPLLEYIHSIPENKRSRYQPLMAILESGPEA
ncbi:hypothetical protein H4R33_005269 [Dimargaris cristalligena]|nr:hypothetical protein H4R33_005269 [Dimargaris cristalligena]